MEQQRGRVLAWGSQEQGPSPPPPVPSGGPLANPQHLLASQAVQRPQQLSPWVHRALQTMMCCAHDHVHPDPTPTQPALAVPAMQLCALLCQRQACGCHFCLSLSPQPCPQHTSPTPPHNRAFAPPFHIISPLFFGTFKSPHPR